MKFQAEIDLVETLKTSLKQTFHRSKIKIFEEVSLGYGVADIVVSEICDNIVGRDFYSNTLDTSDINVFLIVEKANNISLSEIVNLTRSSKRSIIRSISNLTSRGYIEERGGVYFLTNSYQMSFVKNFAIEAKLKDWKRALKQAYRYKWFAEYSFVVLDAHFSKPALKNINVFKKYNVGLASVSVSGKLKRHFNPKPQSPLDPTMRMLFSEQVKRYELAR